MDDRLRNTRRLCLANPGSVIFVRISRTASRRQDPPGHTGWRTSVVAGTGAQGFGGDGGPATGATFFHPEAVVADGEGNLYVADSINNRIRRIALSSGLIATIAGTGEEGDSGHGGVAASARLRRPQALALEPSGGGLLIADTGNSRIRRVDLASGIITTVAGSGTQVRRVDGSGVIHAVAGTSYPSWNGDGPATKAQLSQTPGVAVAPNGDLYISDGFTHLIRRLRASDGTLERVAGTGNFGTSGDGGPAAQAKLGHAMGMTVAPDGDLLFADDGQHRVRRIDAATGRITTIAGTGEEGFGGDGGPATAARLSSPPTSSSCPTEDAGYWLVASDGGIFAFDAPFYGSMGGTRLNRPVTGWWGPTTAT